MIQNRGELFRQRFEEFARQNESLICSNYVLVETICLIQRRFGLGAVRSFHQDVCPVVRVHWVDEATHQAGMGALLGAARGQVSLVDFVSFEVMRRIGTTRVFCYDPHFKQQGFDAIG
ncbi:MAG: VapC toxin family PIN domain ribonuclease [Planctomycetes bacterium]|nr:VapC toxin family PIN domain ribonuclease [Planctomycetota bacterium]